MSKPQKHQHKEQIKKILVPVDYSECSEFACRYALKLACVLGAEIKLLHAFYTPAFDLIELSGTVQIQSQLKDEVSANLEATEKETAEKFISDLRRFITGCKKEDILITYDIAPGMPEDVILNYSMEYKPDLVLMGTQGKSKANTIMGSVTETMIRKLKCPVMAVPEKYSFVGEKNVKNLMYVTDFDESDFVSIKKLMDLTQMLNLKIFCVHISHDEGEWDKIKLNGLKEYFRSVYDKPDVECGRVDSKNILKEIDMFVQKNHINIISLTTRQRGIIEKLFKSDLTGKLFYHTSIPLLVFHS
ncbi:MAG: universal stress protein [Bacteroidales bacterium]|nr:universal stress protein [Bacteroidales bacterium]